MSKDGDFASLMEGGGAQSQARASRRLRSGEVVEGTIVQIGSDSIFIDVGATTEGRLDRGELEDKGGKLKVKVGEVLRVTVVSSSDVTGPVLTVALGRGAKRGAVDLGMLQSARESGLPVTGTVQSAVKGGLEVDVAGVRAFCPASQVDTVYVSDLSSFVGQALSFRVIEIKDDGKSVVLSRKALLAEEREREAQRVLAGLQVGGDYEGTVISLQKYGAFVDLGGGIEGLVHVSELAHSRVDRVEDILSVGEQVTVRLLALEPSDKGPHPRLRLSLKARQQAPESPTPEAGEILTGTVSKVTSFGVFVDTPKGSGLVPVRELGIPRGADYRKKFPVGAEVRVVFVGRGEGGKVTFSVARVAGVEERANYREFTQRGGQAAPTSSGLGALGQALQKTLGLEAPAPESPETAAGAAAPPVSPSPQPSAPSETASHQPEESQREAPLKSAKPARRPPPGMFRRKG
jgi:small subunit ribosomal protein S1